MDDLVITFIAQHIPCYCSAYPLPQVTFAGLFFPPSDGLSQNHAQIVADALVLADLRGVDTRPEPATGVSGADPLGGVESLAGAAVRSA